MNDLTLLSYLKLRAEEEPEKRLLGGETGWLSACRVLSTVENLGRNLLSLGLRPGDLAAVRTERGVDTALLILGMRAAGVMVVLTGPRQEIDEALSDCEAELHPRAKLERRADGSFSVFIDGMEHSLSLNDSAPDISLPRTSPYDPAFVIFTSGSTGKSKAVVQCENNYISNLLDSAPLGYYREDDIALGALPLEHVFGLVLLAGVAVLGYSLFFPGNTGIPSLLDCIRREQITRMNGVPSLYLALAEQSGSYDLSSLRAGFIGGGPVTAAQFAWIEETLGIRLIPVYGLSESVGVSCASYLDPREERAAGVGRVYPMNKLRILTPEGREAAPEQEGEIFVRGPMRMLGYAGSPLEPEDFFPTGDLGWLDRQGVLHLSGRKKDILIRNGNNLSPRRIEDALLSLPQVRAAAVVGLPDERQGETPWAMIVGWADETDLHVLLHKNEWPEGILSEEQLPMTASGKPDKRKIREVLLAWRNG